MYKFNLKNIEINILIRYLFLLFFILFFLSDLFVNVMIFFLSIFSYLFLFLFLDIEFAIGKILLDENLIFLIVDYCVAVSGYMLFFIFFLTLQLDFKILYKILIRGFLIYTLFNTFRIIFLILIGNILGIEYFDLFHLFFYEFLSGIFVGLLVLYFYFKYSLKRNYPIFDDLKYIFSRSE